jgi:hypothetical protein
MVTEQANHIESIEQHPRPLLDGELKAKQPTAIHPVVQFTKEAQVVVVHVQHAGHHLVPSWIVTHMRIASCLWSPLLPMKRKISGVHFQ